MQLTTYVLATPFTMNDEYPVAIICLLIDMLERVDENAKIVNSGIQSVSQSVSQFDSDTTLCQR